MRVLWFATNSANYMLKIFPQKGYNGGGWMAALQNEIQLQQTITLGISFCMDGEPEKITQECVTYYPVPHHKKKKKDKLLDIIHLHDAGRDEVVWQHYISNFKKIILDFKPDIIEVFGSELYIGLATIVAKELNIPCCLHIQGVLSSCTHSFLTPGMSRWTYYVSEGLNHMYDKIQFLAYWKRSCHREHAILNAVPHVIGRTEWDKKTMKVLAPHAEYHYGGEILRHEFYNLTERNIPQDTVITTIISNATYKGFDVVLKTAEILKNTLKINFTWNVFGNINPTFFENTTGLKHNKLNIKLCGVATAQQLCETLLNSTLYCHTSYIENSANSIAEAQILGLPVVASNVGGTETMIRHGETGFLYPVTDPYMAAYHIMQLINDKNLNIKIGQQAKTVATSRHNKQTIVNQLIDTYNTIINEHQGR